MKIILASFFLLISTLSLSQKGFDVIRKAEKKIEKGKFEKALKLLDRAGSMNYGFCGNAWIEAVEAIALNRAKVFDLTGEPLKAAIALNNQDFIPNLEADSIKTAYLIAAFGKEIVKQQIDSSINTLSHADLDNMEYSTIKLAVIFTEEPIVLTYCTAPSSPQDADFLAEATKNKGILERFQITLRLQPFYKLLE